MVYGLNTNICDKFIYEYKLKMFFNTLVKKKKSLSIDPMEHTQLM